MRWGHWLMSHAAAWQRDDMRLRDLLPRVATLPLGSGGVLLMGLGVQVNACYGSTYPRVMGLRRPRSQCTVFC